MNPGPSGKTILIVAEESDTRIFLSNFLTAGGFSPVSTDSMAGGIEKARSLHPDLIVLDVMMANREGIRLYHHLKHDPSLRSIPVIMLSAIDRDTFFLYERFGPPSRGAALAEPDAYLEKPPEADELIRLVRSLAEGKKEKGAASADVVKTT